MKPKLTLPGGRGGRSCLRRAWGRRSRTSPVGSGRTRRGTGICMPACPDPRPWLRTNDSSLAVGYGGDCWMDRWPWRRWPSFSFPISLSAPMHPNDPPTNASRQAGPCAGQRQPQVAASGHVAPSWAWDPPVTWLPPLATPPSNSASRACSLHMLCSIYRRMQMQAGDP